MGNRNAVSFKKEKKKKELCKTFERLEEIWDEYSVYNKDKDK